MALTKRLFVNNFRTTLASAISPADLVINLATGAGSLLFPPPNSSLGEYYEITMQDAATGLRTEIIAISAVTGDVLTVHSGSRGQQSTAAQPWAAGDTVFLAVTKGSMEGFVQPAQIQAGSYLYADADGTADAITATFSPAIAALSDGMAVYVDAASANATTTPTFSPNGLTAHTIVKNNAQALAAGDISGAGHILHLVYRLSASQWELLNPAGSVVTTQYDSAIKTIAASVAANALTISTPASQVVNFRSSTLSDGTINSRTVAAQSLVVPSGATLGTISANQSRLAVLAIDNAGTPELAVTNIAAGKNLDESTLINTNAIATVATGTGVIAVTTGILTISGSPTGTWQVGQIVQGSGVPAGTYITALGTGTGGAGTYQTNITTAVSSTAMTGAAGMGIYSTAARSSLPFRVLGYVESTQATAGTWATTPSTVQGCGGEAFSAFGSLGFGQTEQDVTASRAYSTTYYNTTGKPIFLKVTGATAVGTGSLSLTKNGKVVGSSYSNNTTGGAAFILTDIIMPNQSYSVASINCNLANWVEIR